MTVDAITLALLGETLTSYVREMRTAVIRTAFSPMIHEGHDFSCAIMTMTGDLVAASEVDQPTHLSSLPWSARAVLERYGNDIADGDLYLFNDPYRGGTRLNDVCLIKPVFIENEPLALLGVMAHWQDIGGMVPGSLSGHATEIFQEGIRLPALRYQRRGIRIAEVLDLLFANLRDPADRSGDLAAMEGACNLAEFKLKSLATRRGVALLRETMVALLDRAEQRMRAAIAELPDGTWRCETHLDNSGNSPEPIALKIALTIKGDSLTADFTGCPPIVPGPTNIGPAHTATAVYTMTKAFLDPHGPINAGAMRPLTIVVPANTMLNAQFPAACGAIGEVRRALEGLVMGALGCILPSKAIGDLKGASNITTIAWRGRPPFVEFPAGGTGGWAGADGNSAVRNFAEGDLSSIQPAEAVELRWPLRVDRCELRTNSGGAGIHRGGLGLSREIRILEDGATLSLLSDKNVIPPYGVNGAEPGAPNRFVIRRDGTEIIPGNLPGKVSAYPLKAGDIVIMQTAGGGGFGDPTKRDPALTHRDEEFGYVTSTSGHAPHHLRPHRTDTPPGKRRALISPRTAERLNLTSNALVEFLTTGPALRAWITIDPAIPSDHIGLDTESLTLLNPASSVTFRPIERIA